MVWESDWTGQSQIYRQRLNAVGTPLGSESRINTNTTSAQSLPTLTALLNGGLFSAWGGRQTGDSDIYGRRSDANATLLESESRINTNTSINQDHPAAARLSGGGIIVVWQGIQTGDYDIYGQRSDAKGVPIPPGVVITPNSTISQPSATPSVASQTMPSTSAFSQATSSMTTGPSTSPTSSPFVQSSSLPGPTVPIYSLHPVETLVYDQSYPLYFNGQIIGSYTINGGVGPVQESSSNSVVISLNAGIDLPDGTSIELFTVPNATGTWATTSSFFFISSDCKQVESSVTINNGSPIYIVNTIYLCSPGAKEILTASILLT